MTKQRLRSLVFSLLTAVIAMGLLVACAGHPSSKQTQQENKVVNNQQEIYANGQPVPIFNYSQTRQTLIEIYKAKTGNVATWTVFYSFGKPIYVCPSIGYPIPATTQLTNPDQIIVNTDNGNIASGAIPQAEPDGTFTGTTNATYVACVRADGTISPVYAEPDVIAFPYPVKIDAASGAVTDAGGQSSVSVPRHTP